MAGEIFVSYRRSDTSGFAGRLYDHLQAEFGSEAIFMDVDAIKPGIDFVELLHTEVGHCQAFLAVIGPDWLEATDENGLPRLDSDNDFVRIEIEAALARNILVVPVLVNDAQMPSADRLPESIRGLTRRQALRLTHEYFGTDIRRLIRVLREYLSGFDATLLHSKDAINNQLLTHLRLSDVQIARFVERWSGDGVYVFDHRATFKSAYDVPQTLRVFSFGRRYNREIDARKLAGVARDACVIPTSEHIAAAFLSFKDLHPYCCLAVCQTGFYHYHLTSDDRPERAYVSFEIFLKSPITMEYSSLTLGGKTLHLSGHSMNFDSRSVERLLRELQVRIQNELRFILSAGKA